jgi:hypothetical protein
MLISVHSKKSELSLTIESSGDIVTLPFAISPIVSYTHIT